MLDIVTIGANSNIPQLSSHMYAGPNLSPVYSPVQSQQVYHQKLLPLDRRNLGFSSEDLISCRQHSSTYKPDKMKHLVLVGACYLDTILTCVLNTVDTD